jgi:N-acetylmuramoyl-L-alanine amidase
MKRREEAICMAFLWLSFLVFPSLSHPDPRVEIHTIRHHVHPSFTRVVVEVGKVREFNFNELTSPDRVYVDIYRARLNPVLHNQTYSVESGYLHQIRIAQKNPSTVRVVVDLDFNAAYYRVWHLPEPFRIIIDVYPKKTPVPPPGPKPKTSIIRQLGLGIQRVVIDPGHGGKDPGCVGKNKHREKEVVLDVALRLKKLLDPLGLDVILTRETDIYLAPETRTVIANQKQADLFISIHANASRNRKLSGVETFFLNLSQDPSVVETAARENAASTKSISRMRDTIQKILQNTKISESKELAQIIQKNLVENLSQKYSGVNNLGVKGGPFWVLIGAEVPSVLVEISFLSNAKEEERLRTSEYRQRIAQGIYQGIIAYKSSLEKGMEQ